MELPCNKTSAYPRSLRRLPGDLIFFRHLLIGFTGIEFDHRGQVTATGDPASQGLWQVILHPLPVLTLSLAANSNRKRALLPARAGQETFAGGLGRHRARRGVSQSPFRRSRSKRPEASATKASIRVSPQATPKPSPPNPCPDRPDERPHRPRRHQPPREARHPPANRTLCLA
jgi:hypothetical protein